MSRPDQSSNRWLELLLLFVGLPPALLLPLALPVKLLAVASAAGYCLLIAYTSPGWDRHRPWIWPPQRQWRPVLVRFTVLGGLLALVTAWWLPDRFLDVAHTSPVFWLGISLFYSVVSVIPQEWLYRRFVFQHYRSLVPDGNHRVLLSALLFSWAHIIFLDPLILLLTFIGGLLFADTYRRSGSLPLVSLEHAAWGVLLFTVGLGDQLAFPSPR